jgi:hypothetical protein
MRLERKDLTAASVAIVIVGVLVTTAAGWGVPLIGDSVFGFLAAVLAIATGSLAALVLLVVDVLALIAVDAARHVRQARGTPATT